MTRHRLTVNGQSHEVDADPAMPLLWVLRDRLGLLGTKYGCGAGICGACTVHEDGRAVRSCLVPLGATREHAYVTIEGLASRGDHPVQRAWLEHDVAQCGFCQPGFIMEAAALLRFRPHATSADVEARLATHVCRCGTYTRMRAAMKSAAEER